MLKVTPAGANKLFQQSYSPNLCRNIKIEKYRNACRVSSWYQGFEKEDAFVLLDLKCRLC